MSTLWQGRFNADPEKIMLDYTSSLDFDKVLAQADIKGSLAHISGLKKASLITAEEHSQLKDALAQTGAELESAEFEFQPTDEDIHTAIERRVTELTGDTGAKLHTGRSRNDQVATALKLWTKEQLSYTANLVLSLQETLLAKAQEAGSASLPGYTHLQRAQPVFLAEHLLAHGWAFSRDISRMQDCLKRMDISPLGAGALAGSSLGIDPNHTAKELDFAGGSFQNSLDAVSDRDFAAEALFSLTLLAVHLSRMGEEVVFWSSAEVGFLELSEAWATGSSMLPQKKNPDIAELARAKAGRIIGSLTGLLATLKGLPLAYNRDLQEDKEPLMDSFKQVQLGLLAFTGLIDNSVFNTEAMAKAVQAPELAAIAIAEHLVQEGTPFRQAHARVGELVRQWQVEGIDAKELTSKELGQKAGELIPARPFKPDPSDSIKGFQKELDNLKKLLSK